MGMGAVNCHSHTTARLFVGHSDNNTLAAKPPRPSHSHSAGHQSSLSDVHGRVGPKEAWRWIALERDVQHGSEWASHVPKVLHSHGTSKAINSTYQFPRSLPSQGCERHSVHHLAVW